MTHVTVVPFAIQFFLSNLVFHLPTFADHTDVLRPMRKKKTRKKKNIKGRVDVLKHLFLKLVNWG